MKNIIKDIFLFIGICISVSFFVFGFYLIYENKVIMNKVKLNDTREIVDSCKNLSIFESAKCVIDHTNFEYNMSNLGKKLDWATFEKEGGVCIHFAKFYCEIGKELGFYTNRVEIQTGYENLTFNGKYDTYFTKHSFCIWSDEEGWVGLDQNTPFNFKFEKMDYDDTNH